MICIYCGWDSGSSNEHPACREHSILRDSLVKAEARYQRAFRRSEEAREERNRLVREALTAGWTHQRIADATGLTRGRIGQLR